MPVNYQTFKVDHKVAMVITTDSADLFDYSDLRPKQVKKGYRGAVVWGEDNDLPDQILEKIRNSEVMSANKLFNSLVGYGRGLNYYMDNDGDIPTEVKQWFRRNNTVKYLLEQIVDQKHFYFSIALVILTNDGKKIARLKHKEAIHARFEVNNEKTGKIENVFFGVWNDNPKDDKVQVYPVLDEDDPLGDLLVRMGKEPDPAIGKTRPPTKDRIFAVVTRFPTPGHKYYPFAPYYSHFNSSWYDVAAMIPIGKKAKMTNGLVVKWHVEMHSDYFKNLHKKEGITDPEKQKAREEKEFNDIKTFIQGIENAGKVWYSGFYIDPVKGTEISMIKITKLDTGKEGGDWIEDAEEAASVQCYVDTVHPQLIGAVPGKSKSNMSGTDKRELFTMKQAMEKPFRDLMLIPYEIVREFNGWPEELTFEIPDMLLTTLDKGTDAKTTETNTQIDDNNNN